MRIKITRSFERTRQIADFVPIKTHCEISMEIDLEPNQLTEIVGFSSRLDATCQAEVEKTLMSYQPVCIVCGGKGRPLNKEGVCGKCYTDMSFQAQKVVKSTKNQNT